MKNAPLNWTARAARHTALKRMMRKAVSTTVVARSTSDYEPSAGFVAFSLMLAFIAGIILAGF